MSDPLSQISGMDGAGCGPGLEWKMVHCRPHSSFHRCPEEPASNQRQRPLLIRTIWLYCFGSPSGAHQTTTNHERSYKEQNGCWPRPMRPHIKPAPNWLPKKITRGKQSRSPRAPAPKKKLLQGKTEAQFSCPSTPAECRARPPTRRPKDEAREQK